MYDGDTFFILTITTRIGLVLLSMALAALTAATFIKISCSLAWPARLSLALVFFWVFVWLSPQAFYLYYTAVLEHLPLHNVVQSPPGPGDIFSLLSFTAKSDLSHHAQGLLGWGLIALACLGERVVLSNRLRAALRL